MYHPSVRIGASGGILDPEYCLTRTVSISSSREGGVTSWDDMNDRVIVKPCKLTLGSLGVAVLFGKHNITTFIEDRVREEECDWLDHLVNFIIYKSRVNYRIYSFPARDAAATFEASPEAGGVITFNVERLKQEQGIRHDGHKYVAMGVESYRLEVERSLFDRFDKLIDTTLAAAITYFLIAAENPLYFLVEYYKCYEVIKRTLGGEKELVKALTLHGFTDRMGSDLTRMANNNREPLSFGRHAPDVRGRVIGVNLRDLYNPTVQRELFDQATGLCRACIDAFILHLLDRN